MMDLIRLLADAGPVAHIQRLCGVDYEKPITCDQQTQTRRESSDSNKDQPSEHVSTHRIAQPVNSLQDGRKIKVHAEDIDLSTRQDFGNNATKIKPRNVILSATCLKEHNNNGTIVTSSNNIRSDCDNTCGNNIRSDGDNNDTSNCTTLTNESNCYQIMQPSIKVCRKTNPLEYRSNSSELHFSKEGNDHNHCDNMSPAADSSSSHTPIVLIKYKPLFYLARFGAFLGNELFYLTFFPFLIWNLDALVVRQVSMLWCVVMYLGQATKDYLRWPRPRCPPVIRLEVHYTREYSMPSTHAMAGTAIPLYLAYLAVERYQVPVFVAGPIALMWLTVTCWSRLYLGVHSILDLLVGCLYALVIFFTFLGYVEGYDLYLQTHPFGAPVLLFTALTLCTVLYPTHHKNSSKADAVQIVSAYTGLGIGSWLGYQLGYMHMSDISQPYLIAVPTLSWCVMALLRFITGTAVVGFLYTSTKWWSVRFYSYIYGLDEPDKSYPGVVTAYKFTTYAVVGAGAALIAPLVHLHLNIHRPSLFYEVL